MEEAPYTREIERAYPFREQGPGYFAPLIKEKQSIRQTLLKSVTFMSHSHGHPEE